MSFGTGVPSNMVNARGIALLAAIPLGGGAVAQLPAGFVEEAVLSHPTWGTTGRLPTGLAFTPDGSKLFFSLRDGDVRWVSTASLPLAPGDEGNLFVALATYNQTSDERGILDVAVHPDYATNGEVYVFYTPQSLGGAGAEIVRFNDVGGQGTNPTTVVGGIPQATFHNGGKTLVGPDGALYFSLGDTTLYTLVEDPTTPFGKIHRVDATTGAPLPDNPFGASNTAWSYGHRNVFGMAFSPFPPRALFVTDDMEFCRDELNRVEAGLWYGWRQPIPNCPWGDPNFPIPGTPPVPFVPPLFVYPQCPTHIPPTPTGIDFCYHGAWPAEYVGDLFTVDYNSLVAGACAPTSADVRRFVLTGTPSAAEIDRAVDLTPGAGTGVFAPLPNDENGIALRFSPAGDLYVATRSEIRRIRYTGALPDFALSLHGIPGLGRTVGIHGVHGDPGWLGVLVFAASTAPPTPTPWGDLEVNPLFAVLFPGGAFDAARVKTRTLPIPNDPVLQGGTVYFQGFEVDLAPPGGGHASTPLAVTIQ